MPRIVPFVAVAVVASVFAAVAGEFPGVFEGRSVGRAFLVMAATGSLGAALSAVAGSLADRWTPAFREHPERLILGEMRAIPAVASADLESEILDADCGYHVHRGASSREQSWAASPLAEDDTDPGVDYFSGLSFVQEWVEKHAPLLLNESGVVYTCETRGNIVRVVIPRVCDSGFDVTIKASTFGVLVSAGTLFHAHFPSRTPWDGSADEFDEREDKEFYDSDPSRESAEQALGLVRDLLSLAVRIRERRAGGIPYYAALEARVGGEWRQRRAVVLLRYPYWGRREERVWANTHLDPRMADTVP